MADDYKPERLRAAFQSGYRAGLEEIHKELLAMTYKCSVESIPHKLFYLIAAKLKEQP